MYQLSALHQAGGGRAQPLTELSGSSPGVLRKGVQDQVPESSHRSHIAPKVGLLPHQLPEHH